MAESLEHSDLVRIMSNYVQKNLGVEYGHILLDLPELHDGSKPPFLGAFRPDLYVRTNDILIIGEAKTQNDWDRRHSHDQYQAFMGECNKYKMKSFLLLIIPWRYARSLKSRLKFMFNTSQPPPNKIVVISDLDR